MPGGKRWSKPNIRYVIDILGIYDTDHELEWEEVLHMNTGDPQCISFCAHALSVLLIEVEKLLRDGMSAGQELVKSDVPLHGFRLHKQFPNSSHLTDTHSLGTALQTSAVHTCVGMEGTTGTGMTIAHGMPKWKTDKQNHKTSRGDGH